MATKRFCDICDKQMQPEDDQAFSRSLEYFKPPFGPREINQKKDAKAFGFIMIVNENNHPLTDVCNECKLKIVNEGTDESPNNTSSVATLQPVAADTRPPVKLFTPPSEPESLPFVRSIPDNT